MAVGLIVELQGLSTADYDRINEHLGFPEHVPDGLIMHVAGPAADGNGVQVVDIWESRSKFDTFIQTEVVPAMEKAGLAVNGAPKTEEFTVHNSFGLVRD